MATINPVLSDGGTRRRKSVTSVKKAKRKLELMAIYIVTTFLACYTVYYVSQIVTNRMTEHEKVQRKCGYRAREPFEFAGEQFRDFTIPSAFL